MKKFQFRVGYNEDKIKALRISLKDKNKDLDEEIINFLDGLYNKNVPKVLKKYIELGVEVQVKNIEKIIE